MLQDVSRQVLGQRFEQVVAFALNDTPREGVNIGVADGIMHVVAVARATQIGFNSQVNDELLP